MKSAVIWSSCSDIHGVWPLVGVAGGVLCLAELDLAVVQLGDGGTAAVLGGNWGNLQDLDGSGTGTMAGTHITVSLSDGVGGVGGSVLAVHVVGSRSGVVTEPDAE